jgi:hypothetical protein
MGLKDFFGLLWMRPWATEQGNIYKKPSPLSRILLYFPLDPKAMP